MSKLLKLELNRSGVRELLQSPEMAAICEELAQGIASSCGDGFEVSTYTGTNRVNASVVAVTKEAYQQCLDNNVVLEAMGHAN